MCMCVYICVCVYIYVCIKPVCLCVRERMQGSLILLIKYQFNGYIVCNNVTSTTKKRFIQANYKFSKNR